ncbi:MAG TPA: amidohydrolase, partial [Ktedonobacterales bacterium]|nr:amidohydrolase [Ktedonobacterales bacterium]
HVDACFGLHLANNHEVGKMVVQGGSIQASADEFDITVEGVGGHGASPHQTVDPIAVGAAIVGELQRIVSREVNPQDAAVITVGVFHSGTKHNIIPRRAEMKGTVRALTPETREYLLRRIGEVATHVAEAARATADARITTLYPVTVNDDQMAAFARTVAETIVPPDSVITARPIMGAEDMSFFLNAAPGCFVFLGSANHERHLDAPHHSALFDFDEACLPMGVELLSSLALAYLR